MSAPPEGGSHPAGHPNGGAVGGYAGKLIVWVKECCGLLLEIVKRTDDVKGRRGVKLLPELTQTRAEADRVAGELRGLLGLPVEVTSDE